MTWETSEGLLFYQHAHCIQYIILLRYIRHGRLLYVHVVGFPTQVMNNVGGGCCSLVWAFMTHVFVTSTATSPCHAGT